MNKPREIAADADLRFPNAAELIAEAADCCTQACTCCLENGTDQGAVSAQKRLQKIVAMYLTMVMVSTLAIYFLEHASLLSAFRTALVAAIGKTVAANWVSSCFN